MLKSQAQPKEKTVPYFVKLPLNYYKALNDIQPSANKIYVILVKHADNKTGECHLSTDTLSNITNISKRQIYRAIKQLEKLDLLSVIRKHRHSNEYQINYKPVVLSDKDVTQSNPKNKKIRVTKMSPKKTINVTPMAPKDKVLSDTQMSRKNDVWGDIQSNLSDTQMSPQLDSYKLDLKNKNIATIKSKDSQVALPDKKTRPKTDPNVNIKDHTKWGDIYKPSPSGVIALWVDHWKVHIGTSVNKLSGKDAVQGKYVYQKAGKDVTKAGLIIRQAFNEYHKQAPNGVWPFNKGQAPTLDKICSAYLKLDAMIPKPEPEPVVREKTDAEIFWEDK